MNCIESSLLLIKALSPTVLSLTLFFVWIIFSFINLFIFSFQGEGSTDSRFRKRFTESCCPDSPISHSDIYETERKQLREPVKVDVND